MNYFRVFLEVSSLISHVKIQKEEEENDFPCLHLNHSVIGVDLRIGLLASSIAGFLRAFWEPTEKVSAGKGFQSRGS